MALIYYLVAYIDADALTPSFEAHREATIGERGHGDKCVGCVVNDGNGTEDRTEVGIVRALEFRIVGEGDGERARPRMNGKFELLNRDRVGEGDIGATIRDTRWGRRNQAGCEGETRWGGCRAAGIPDCFCLGTVGEQSPVALGAVGRDHVGNVVIVVEVCGGVRQFWMGLDIWLGKVVDRRETGWIVRRIKVRDSREGFEGTALEGRVVT